MRALILGGNGFIGSHLVEALSEEGHFVRVFDKIDNSLVSRDRHVEYYVGDISDSSSSKEALNGIDIVYHLASASLPGTSNIDPINDIQSNLIPTIKLLDTMTQLDIKKIVFLSSGGTVYGNPTHSMVSENDLLNPLCSYAIVKVSIEHYLLMYQHLHGLQPTIFRPSNPFGPRQSHIGVQGLVSTIFSRIMTGESITVWGDGSHIRDYIYISDLIDLCVKAGKSSATGVYNVGKGKGYSVNDMIRKIEEVTRSRANVKYEKARPFDVEKNVLDISKARTTFGWSPRVAINDGLKEYWKWIQTHNQ